MTGPQPAGADSQAFAPGSAPPSAALPQELAAATSITSQIGAVSNSGTYLTEGVAQTLAAPPLPAATPLTPSDVAGQIAKAPSPMPNPLPAASAAEEPLAKPTLIAEAGIEPGVEQDAMRVPAPAVTTKTARAVAEPKQSLLGRLFGNKPKANAAEPETAAPAALEEGHVQLASLETAPQDPVQQTETLDALPGVNAKNLFELDPAAGGTIGADGGFYEEEPEVQLASATAAGLARLAPNGLMTQTDRVEIGCFKPELVAVLKKIERHYGKKVVVTSGYRSPQGNRKAGGSRQSLHMMCAAADIQVSGVGKWELAKQLRSMPGRGGVGTYCYTDSVHIDVGSQRDWNWRCRRR